MKRLPLLAVLLTLPFSALAYSDVPRGAWFEESVDALVEMGALDGSKDTFRPGDTATRAEFIKLVVTLNGGILGSSPNVPSFTDVPKEAWYFGVMEEAGKEGWVRGEGDCYGEKTCYAHPETRITRAEAAALLARALLEPLNKNLPFPDVPKNAWFADAIQTAAAHCVIQGDDSTGNVRPGDPMNRAEMAVMLERAKRSLAESACPGPDLPPEDEPETPASSSSSSQPADEGSAYPLGAALGTLPGGNKDKGIRRGEGGIAMLPVDFSADCAALQVIRSVRIHHGGSGSSLDITNVYAKLEGTIVGTGEYDWRDRSWLITLDERTEIPACGTETVTFTADYSSKALPHGEHMLILKEASSVATDDALPEGNYPIESPVFTVY